MRASIVLAVLCDAAVLCGAAATSPAEAQARTVHVLVREDGVSPALSNALGAELAASGARVVFVRDLDALGPTDAVIEVRVEGDRAVAAAYRGRAAIASTTLPEGDVEAAALAAASLAAELRGPLRALTDPGGPSVGLTVGRELGHPRAAESVVPDEPTPARSAFVLELGATTGIIQNGVTLGVGALIADAFLVRVHARVLYAMEGGGISTLTELSIGYAGSVGSVQLEVGAEVGAFAESIDCGASCWNAEDNLGLVAGAFFGVMFARDSELAPVLELSPYLISIRSGFGFGGLLSLSLRWSAR